MVAGAGRMSSATIKRQPINQQKRKCTRADPTQTRILLKNYDAEARPSAEQFADMSQKTNLPVDWIKKWFLRKRKADGKNRTLVPTEPTFVENEPSAQLGHAHSKFWSLDAFAAADSTSFSPSVGHIPKFYGHRRRGLPPGNADNYATESRGNEEEREILSSGPSAGTGFGYVVPSDSVLTDERNPTPASYDLREVLLGAGAFAGFVSPSANEDASGFPSSEHLPAADELLSAVSSPERSTYPDDPSNKELSCSESATDLELSLTDYGIASIYSPIDAIDDFISASGDLDLISIPSCSTSDDLGLSAFDSATSYLDSDVGLFSTFANIPSYMTSALGEPFAFYENILFQAKQDLMGDSIDATNCGSLLGIDVCFGAAPMTTGHELESASALGLAFVNDDDVCDPTTFMMDFGGFDGHANCDSVKRAAEGVDSDEGRWTDELDTMFGLGEDLWSDWKS